MNWLGYTLIGAILFIIAFCVFYSCYLMPTLRKNDVCNRFEEILKERDEEYEIKKFKGEWCDFRLDLKDKTYYVKHFVVPGREEVVINNPYKWQVLGGSKGFLFLKGVEAFVDGPCNTDKEIVKVAVFYTHCKLVMYYKNECDMDFVSPRTSVHGIKFIGFDELEDKFDWL